MLIFFCGGGGGTGLFSVVGRNIFPLYEVLKSIEIKT